MKEEMKYDKSKFGCSEEIFNKSREDKKELKAKFIKEHAFRLIGKGGAENLFDILANSQLYFYDNLLIVLNQLIIDLRRKYLERNGEDIKYRKSLDIMRSKWKLSDCSDNEKFDIDHKDMQKFLDNQKIIIAQRLK